MIHFVTALHCEARPLIEQFRLKPIGNHGRVSLYNNRDVSLAVSGVGILQSAIAATALEQTKGKSKSDLWLNLGICGHRILPIGETVLANRISSTLHHESYYPRLLAKSPFTQAGLKTLTEPTSDYPDSDAVEMEAYGFFQACLHFSTLERIQAIKIVSDNAKQDANRNFDKEQISQLISDRLDQIEAFARELHELVRSPEPKSSIEALETTLLAAHHYSVTERHQLHDRLEKLAYLKSDSELPDPASLASLSKPEAAKAIDELINQISVVSPL